MLKFIFPLMLTLMTYNYYSWFINISITMTMSMMLMYMLTSSSFLVYKYSLWSMADLMSMPLLILTLWMSALMIMASFNMKMDYNNQKNFMTIILLLNFILFLAFCSSNLILFYIFFEASLIPTMLLIMKWGYQPERIQASLYLMMYTVTASLPMLSCLIYASKLSYTMEFSQWFMFSDSQLLKSLWMISIMGFLIKLPMYITHLWLPKAHVEAPIAGSMVLAAILLKLGGYGLVRLSMMYQWMNKYISNSLVTVSLLGGVITSMICLRQSDLKSLIAYSSVSHMGILISGTMTSTKWGLMGAMSMMIAHAFSSSALFIMANINYDFTKSRSFILAKGMLMINPLMTLFWFMFVIMNMAAPPTINLMSEIILMTSLMSFSLYSMIMLGLISFVTVAYSLYMYTSINHSSSNQIMSIMGQMKIKDMNLLIFHLIPSFMLIIKSEMIFLLECS
nr:TPA: NADH dehydrogenase subunit 4 [Cylicobdellidae sp. FA-2019]